MDSNEKSMAEIRAFILHAILLGTIFTLIALLAGCAEWTAVKAGAASHGAQASDAALEASVWEICYASPVGAIRRRFQSSEDVQAWQRLCRESSFSP